MNLYLVLIVSTLFFTFIIDLVSQWLNLRSLDPALPDEFRSVYDSEKYKKSQEYTKTTTKFHIVESAFSLIVLLAFWFLGGFNKVDIWVRHWNLNPISNGLAYVGILVVAGDVLSLPFASYATFVIEEKFGFNRTTAATFITDRLKGLGLQMMLGGTLLAVILWFFELMGNSAWLYCWVVSTVLILVLQFLAPIWIMPLFNKFTPLQEGELRDAISNYAKSIRFSFKNIFVMDGSKRSSKANAFFTGFGKNKRIALFDTLLAEQTVPETVAVLAHEIGHFKKGHILQTMAISILHLGVLFFLLSLFINNQELFAAFSMEQISVYGSLVFFGLLYEPVSFLLSMLMNLLSRHNELTADRFAAETLTDREFLISALMKLSVNNLSNLTPHPFYVFLNYSHPPLLQRIETIRSR